MTNLTNIYFWNPAKQEIADLKTIREQNQNASIPEGADISVLGWFVLEETDAPAYNNLTHALVWVVGIEQSNKGPRYVRNYSVSPLSKEQSDTNYQEFFEQQKKAFIATVQKKLDLFAYERGYDDIKSAIGYLQSSIPQFKQEAEICLEKRDQMWYALFGILNKVQNQEIEVPMDFSDIESELPTLDWN